MNPSATARIAKQVNPLARVCCITNRKPPTRASSILPSAVLKGTAFFYRWHGIPFPAIREKAPLDFPLIAVINHDNALLDLLNEILTDEGYAVVCAASKVEALMVMESNLPALVLLDPDMPEVDGWQFARSLAARSLQIPVVILTAAEGASRHAEGLRAAGWLRKPFDLTELLDTVERAYRSATQSAHAAG